VSIIDVPRAVETQAIFAFSSSQELVVLVTGANKGIGLGIVEVCSSLLDLPPCAFLEAHC
jgi:hypothetical protein